MRRVSSHRAARFPAASPMSRLVFKPGIIYGLGGLLECRFSATCRLVGECRTSLTNPPHIAYTGLDQVGFIRNFSRRMRTSTGPASQQDLSYFVLHTFNDRHRSNGSEARISHTRRVRADLDKEPTEAISRDPWQAAPLAGVPRAHRLVMFIIFSVMIQAVKIERRLANQE